MLYSCTHMATVGVKGLKRIDLESVDSVDEVLYGSYQPAESG